MVTDMVMVIVMDMATDTITATATVMLTFHPSTTPLKWLFRLKMKKKTGTQIVIMMHIPTSHP